jgi:hypothetical protein
MPLRWTQTRVGENLLAEPCAGLPRPHDFLRNQGGQLPCDGRAVQEAGRKAGYDTAKGGGHEAVDPGVDQSPVALTTRAGSGVQPGGGVEFSARCSVDRSGQRGSCQARDAQRCMSGAAWPALESCQGGPPAGVSVARPLKSLRVDRFWRNRSRFWGMISARRCLYCHVFPAMRLRGLVLGSWSHRATCRGRSERVEGSP